MALRDSQQELSYNATYCSFNDMAGLIVNAL